MGNHPLLNGLP